MNILAIDPGTTHSAYVITDPSHKPLQHGKVENALILALLSERGYGYEIDTVDRVVIEMIASYGMPVGADVFTTCVWIGRFQQTWADSTGVLPELVFRKSVKMHHCLTNRAKDSNITQALVDRFASGEPNRGKGTKAQPGWFHGFAADVWQAYALAVYAADTGTVIDLSPGAFMEVGP